LFPKFIKFTLHYNRLFRKNPEGNWDFFGFFQTGYGTVGPAQRVRRRKYGGAAALGSPFGGAGERSASLRGRRQWQICTLVRLLQPGTLSVMMLFPYLLLRTPSQSRLSAVPALPMGEPRGGRCPPSAEGKTVQTRRRSRPARGVRTCESGGAAALGSPFGGAGERSARLRGRRQWQIWEMYRDCSRVPSQSRLSAVPALP